MQNPLPPLPDLHAIRFASPLVGFAVGTGGTLLRTSDGGNTWIQAPLRTLKDLKAIHFTDSGTGYVAGSRGALLKTVDQGRTWSELAVGTRLDLACLAFPGKARGFAGGDSGYIFKTEDAGLTWKPIPTGLSTPIHRLQFGDANTAFALSDAVLLKSADGGETWNRLPIGREPASRRPDESAYHMLFQYRMTGYIGWEETYWNNPSTPHYGFQTLRSLFRTTDGGETWTPMERFFQPLQFLGTGEGFGKDGFALLKSAGGTGPWTEAGAFAARPNALWFLDSATGFAVGWLGCVQKTVDGGRNWKVLEGVFPPRASHDSLSTLWSVHFPTPATGYAVGPEGLLRTRDAGANWVLLPLPISARKVYFTSALTGFVLGSESEPGSGKGALLRTTDGGETWEDQSALASGPLQAIHFTSASKGFIVGSSGLVLETHDGGATWKKGWEGAGVDLYAISFRDGKTGFIGGGRDTGDSRKGMLFKTGDGGDTWTRVNVVDPKYPDPETGNGFAEPNGILSSILLPGSASVILVCGEQTWKSTDGGLTWGIFGTLPSNTRSLAYRGEDTAYALGTDLWKSTDGGRTWGDFFLHPHYRLLPRTGFRAMHFSEPGTAYMVGDFGAIAQMRIGSEAPTRLGSAAGPAAAGGFRAGFLKGDMLWYELPRASRVQARIWDLRGRKRADLFDLASGAGRHEYRVPAGIRGRGACVLELRAGNLRRAIRLPGN